MTLQEVYSRLELTDEKGCLVRLSDSEWEQKVSFPSRVSRLLKKNGLLNKLDAFFCFDNKPLILFFDNPKDKEALHQAIWNFNESPVAIIVTNEVVEIFNAFSIDENTKLLKSLGTESKLSDFTYFELVTGKTWERYNDEIRHESRVDYRLLKNIEDAQQLLKEEGLIQVTANALLGKIIFFRYLIDRKVKLNFREKEIWTNDDLCRCLESKDDFKCFVRHIENKDKGFNGDMFRIEDNEFESITQNALNVLIRLLKSEQLSTGQQSLFDLYDFSILPIEFISNVYEKFIGIEKQDEESAYYTPTFLVDYIVSETVGKKMCESDDYNCKVLDPACGSGIFLVESLRRMIEKYISTHNIKETNTIEFKEVLRTIAKENIYGIDKDYSAIQVAIFSVYLTLLDYQTPADIKDFKFPNLLGTNFICCDSFDTENPELKLFEEKRYDFDCIIGNPPWKRSGINETSHCCKYLKSKNYLSVVGNKELAQAFVLRSLDFAGTNTRYALVLASKVFYNIESKDFRTYILDRLYVDKFFEFASVRREVFNKSNKSAIAPSCVLFYRDGKGCLTDNNLLTHIALKPSRFFSLFKVFSLTRNDVQYVSQIQLKQNDWLWKTLVYGSYLDFNFIKRLKSRISIKDIIDSNGFICKQGIKEKDGNKSIDVSSLVGLDYIETKGVSKYYINTERTWNLPVVGYVYQKNQQIVRDIYTAPMLLIKGGTNSNLQAVSAISYHDGVFKSSLTAIKGCDDSAVPILRNILGVLNSTFFSYYNLMVFSSSGIEREETHDVEKFSVPYCEGIDCNVEIIEQKTDIYNKSSIDISQISKDIESELSVIEDRICANLNCTEVERDILAYALDVSIPLATKSKGYQHVFDVIARNDSFFKSYADVFVRRFSNSFGKNGKRFVVEVQYSTQIVGMFFKIIDESEYTDEVVFSEGEAVLSSALSVLSTEKLTDDLFVQKDIRGFENDFFYIFKPNEKRLWHKAIAHLDANEFADAMFKVGGEANE